MEVWESEGTKNLTISDDFFALLPSPSLLVFLCAMVFAFCAREPRFFADSLAFNLSRADKLPNKLNLFRGKTRAPIDMHYAVAVSCRPLGPGTAGGSGRSRRPIRFDGAAAGTHLGRGRLYPVLDQG